MVLCEKQTCVKCFVGLIKNKWLYLDILCISVYSIADDTAQKFLTPSLLTAEQRIDFQQQIFLCQMEIIANGNTKLGGTVSWSILRCWNTINCFCPVCRSRYISHKILCVLYGQREAEKRREICHNTAVPTTDTAWIYEVSIVGLVPRSPREFEHRIVRHTIGYWIRLKSFSLLLYRHYST